MEISHEKTINSKHKSRLERNLFDHGDGVRDEDDEAEDREVNGLASLRLTTAVSSWRQQLWIYDLVEDTESKKEETHRLRREIRSLRKALSAESKCMAVAYSKSMFSNSRPRRESARTRVGARGTGTLRCIWR